jgi:hypothetical protein
VSVLSTGETLDPLPSPPLPGFNLAPFLMQLLLLLFAVYLVFLVETSSIFPFLFALPWMSLLE